MNSSQQYYRSQKGQAAMRRENERRRNKTKFKEVMRQLVSTFDLTKCLGTEKYYRTLKQGHRLKFLQ